VVAEILGTVDLVEKDTDTVVSGHVMKRRVMWFSKLGFLMLCGLYKLLILCIFVTHTFCIFEENIKSFVAAFHFFLLLDGCL
jgi:hypothetical protein